MRLCSKCGQEKPPEWKGGWCPACRKNYMRVYYAKNKERLAAQMRAYRQANPEQIAFLNQQYSREYRSQLNAEAAVYRETFKEEIKKRGSARKLEKRELVRQAKDVPCVDCGRRFPACAMDFDHVAGIKKYNIAAMAGGPHSLAAMLEEMAKCEVVCACCHRVRTANRIKGKAVESNVSASP